RWSYLVGVTGLLAGGLVGLGGGGEANRLPRDLPRDVDEAVCRRAGLATDDLSLLGYLRDASADRDLPLAPLIRQLGAEDFEQREEATRRLVALGHWAVTELERHRNDPDREVSSRVRDCLTRIEGNASVSVPLFVVRLLVRHRAGGAVEALLRY